MDMEINKIQLRRQRSLTNTTQNNCQTTLNVLFLITEDLGLTLQHCVIPVANIQYMGDVIYERVRKQTDECIMLRLSNVNLLTW